MEHDIEKYLLQELSVLGAINHPNLMKYIGACRTNEDSKDVYLLCELYRGGGMTQPHFHFEL